MRDTKKNSEQRYYVNIRIEEETKTATERIKKGKQKDTSFVQYKEKKRTKEKEQLICVNL